LKQVLSSWNHYLSLTHSNIWFFLFSYSLLLLCLIGLGLRLLQRKLSAVYLMLYISILFVWPYPGEMTRFLHPIVFLLILQPVCYYADNHRIRDQFLVKSALVIAILTLIINSIIIQAHMLEVRDAVGKFDPNLAYRYEIYGSPSRQFGFQTATAFSDVTKSMIESAQHVPAQSVVATVKPTNYSILTERRAINLVTTVPHSQQLCNLKVKDADAIFLSDLTTEFNWEGRKQLETFRSISSNVWTLEVGGNSRVAYLVVIDKTKLNAQMEEEGFNCQSFKDHL
jgi:hypothetical protein